MDPPLVSAYNIGALPSTDNSPWYGAAGYQQPNSSFQLHDLTGDGYAPVKEAEKKGLPRAQTRPAKTIGALDLRSGEAAHSRPLPKFLLKPRQAAELAKTADAALPARGPEPRQGIAADPATTAQSETPHRTEDLWLDIGSLLPPVTVSDRFGTPIDKPIKYSPRSTQATSSGQSAADRPSEHTGAAELEDTSTSAKENTDFYDINKPTCSLNLVCYRSGAAGCDLQQLHCILHWKFPSEELFLKMTAAKPHLIATDSRFFQEMRKIYKLKMCGFFRRHFSLKTLKTFRILAVSQHSSAKCYLSTIRLIKHPVRSLNETHSGSIRRLYYAGNDVRVSKPA